MDCERFIIIGSAGWDQDLLGLLSDSITHVAFTRIDFVGAGAQATTEALNRFKDGVPALRRSRYAAEYDTGFSGFFTDPRFRESLDTPD